MRVTIATNMALNLFLSLTHSLSPHARTHTISPHLSDSLSITLPDTNTNDTS